MAQLIEKAVPLPFDRTRYEYEWQGDDATAMVDLYRIAMNQPLKLDRGARPGETFWLGHLELVIIDVQWERHLWEVGLASGRGFQAAYARQLFYFWAHFRSRIILTLYVWGLAAAPRGEILTWKHVHWGRRKNATLV